MLVKPNDNVLPIDGASRASAQPGRHIGAILMDEGKITASDAEQVLARQRELGWRFGEAAIELNLITDADLRQALAKQYEFPYLVSGPEGVSKEDRKSTRLNSSHVAISYAVFCLKKKKHEWK